ncbi:UbiA family prenyltransferase [Jhaorihella thermophila]|uniref:4-hydroxybenzoate polyprenyltransferase n=1 Tax=Jhaorihella thermophila TaxID=488547 RepID=A0A1H5TD06_9RHOB|nr:UbiA family prenyltransferase [Jhaorihella thermophila]SEF59887.1 4-hydroxybenzoate polyprenyltransferase [Jhaorihella thermophila]
MEDSRAVSPAPAGTDPTHPDGDGALPLVLDVDGTLLRTDLLHETFWAALGRRPFATLRATFANLRRPARLKARLREIAMPEVETLPVNDAVLELAVRALDEGRPVHLASAADQVLVDAVGERFGLEGPHFGSDGNRNLKGSAKAQLLTERFGRGGYVYGGDSQADLPCWEGAARAVAVAPRPALRRRIEALGVPLDLLPRHRAAGALLKEMRPHQWIKNLLLLLPALAAHDVSPATLLPVMVAILAFSLGASSIYIVNDLLDLAADRRHPEKSRRPVAAGALPIPRALAASVVLSLVALALALAVSPAVAGITLIYMTGSLVYSLWLKRWRWVDVLALVGFFLLRVLAGAAAAQVAVSGWLFAFVFAVFLVLACTKRLTELARALRRGQLPGRGYSRQDFNRLRALAYAATLGAAGVFLAHAFSPAAQTQYDAPHVLALVAVLIAIWLGRMVHFASRGEEDYDPVRAVTRDPIGLAIAATGIVIGLLAV